MKATHKIVTRVMKGIDQHTTNYNLTEDTEGIYTLEILDPEDYNELKFTIAEHSARPIRTLNFDGVEEYTLTVDDFVTYVFS